MSRGASTSRGASMGRAASQAARSRAARSQAAPTNDTAGARRIADAFARARADGRAALIPYVVAGYPDAEASFAAACAAIDAGADLLEVGLPYSDPLADGATLQRASQGALAAGATFDRSLALTARIAAARPSVPVVAMGYANQLIGGGDGRDRALALAKAGVAGRHRGRPDPRRGCRRSRRSPSRPGSPWSTWWRRHRPPPGVRPSPRAAAGSSTASRWSA